MSINAMLGEAHVPAEQLTSISILMYRTLRSGETEILVRRKLTDLNPTYSVEFKDIQPDETALQCAERLEIEYYSITPEIHAEDLDYQSSAVIDNLGQGIKIRVFMTKTKAIRGMMRSHEGWQGWSYEFIPLSSLDQSLDRVYLHPEIGVTPAALRELLKPPTGRR
ncbi:hypothetical protein RRF57_001179 [Xylaria bambusicola]|uniref:Uncharacterized protein n=1 Tax=Xylaria bambusicola TaxID=326684 RepID=A0AAN7Z3A3_9PEZI